MATHHLSLIKSLTTMPVQDIMKSAKKREFRLRRLESERVTIRGDKKNVQRLYIHTKDSGKYSDVGWIVNDGVEDCMLCGETFGLFLYRHHCRSCGNLLCATCCPYRARVQELNTRGDETTHRVCRLCFWDQEVVQAVVTDERSMTMTNVPSRQSSNGGELEMDHREPFSSSSMYTSSSSSNISSATDRRVNELIQQSGLYSPKSNRRPPSIVRNDDSVMKTMEVMAVPSFVIKVKGTIESSSNAKLFINVLHHKDFPWFLNVNDMPNFQYHSLRKFGDANSKNGQAEGDTYAIDAVCNTNAMKSIPNEKQKAFIEYIVESVRNQDGFTLSPSYTLPKIVNEYKDGPVRMCKLTTMDQQTLPPTRSYSNMSNGSNHEYGSQQQHSIDSVESSNHYKDFSDHFQNLATIQDTPTLSQEETYEKCEYVCVKDKKNIVYDSRRKESKGLSDLSLEPSYVGLGDIFLYSDSLCQKWSEIFVILDNTIMSCFEGDVNEKLGTKNIRKSLCKMFTKEEFVSFTAMEEGNHNVQVALQLPENLEYILKVDIKDFNKKNKKLAASHGEGAVKFTQLYLASSKQQVIKSWEVIINTRSELKKPGEVGYEPDVIKDYLTKQGHFMKSWTKRFFVLEKGILKYYVDDQLDIEKGYCDVNQGTIIEYPYNDVQTQLRLKQKISNKILLLQFHREDDALLWKSILAAHVAFYKDTSQHQEEAAIESTS